MLARFDPIGYELKGDAMKGEEFEGVAFQELGKTWLLYRKGTQTLRNESRMAKSGPIPEQVLRHKESKVLLCDPEPPISKMWKKMRIR